MDVTSNHLSQYLDRIHTFLITEAKSQVFPSLTMAMEDTLVNIAKDANFLKNGMFDDDCKSRAAQITAVLERNKQVFTLSYGFDNDELGKRMMVYKKKPVPEFLKPLGLKQLRKPHSPIATQAASINTPLLDSSETNSVMSSFKTKALNSTLKFVKNEAQLVLEYPDMSSEQAEFVKQMISQCLTTKDGIDTGPGSKGMCDPLAEALRIFSLKYEFKLSDAEPMHHDMKRMCFEKIPKQSKVKEEIDLSVKKKIFKHPDQNVSSQSEYKSTPVNSTSTTKVHTENTIKLNTSLNSLLKAKTKYTTEVNKTVPPNTRLNTNTMPLKSIPNENVNADNTMEVNNNTRVNTPCDLQKENTELNTKTPVNSAPTSKVNTDDAKELGDGEGFIAVRNANYIPNSSAYTKNSKKLIHLIEVIKELSGVFAKNTIKTLRDFISDDQRDTLVFSNLKTDEMQFLLQWDKVAIRLEVIRLFSVEGQMILDEIRSMLDACSGCFKVVVSSKTFSPLNRSVTLTKQYRKKCNAAKNSTVNLAASYNVCCNEDAMSTSNSSLSSSSSTRLYKTITNNNRKVERFFHKTKTLADNWMQTALTQLRDFIKDESQASLLLRSVTHPQMTFLTNWQKMLIKPDVVNTYPPDTQELLKEIHRCVQNANSFTVSVKMTGVTKKQTRDITFTKRPSFPAMDTKTKTGPPANNIGNVPAKSVPKADGNKAKLAASTSVDSVPSNPGQSIPKASSVTSLPVKKAADRPRPKSANVNTKLPKAKAKLIEALSQPVVCEKALIMMRNMGWDGGALGVRGDGIVEPIALPLDLSRRAGLGSIKLPTKQAVIPVMTNLPVNITRVVLPHTPNRTEFKTGVLQMVLEMITAVQPATELSFPGAIALKNWSFIRHIVNTFNCRAKLALDGTLTELCDQILDVMSQTEYIITACWGSTKKNILFVLSKGIYQPSDLDSKDWCSIVNFDNAHKKDKAKDVNDRENVMVSGEPFRYYVLAQILEFCENSNVTIDKSPSKSTLSKEILLKGTMDPKQMSYIKDLVTRLNNKSRVSSDSQNELALFHEIISKIQGFRLDVDFPGSKRADEAPVHKCIRLIKIFHEQSNDSRSLDKPTANGNKIGETAKLNKQKIENYIEVTDKTNDIKNERTKDKDSWSRITIANDKAVEKARIDNQDALILGLSVPINGQNQPKRSQNSPVDEEDTRITPMDSQSAPMDVQNQPTRSLNSPTDKMIEDCICCLQDFDLNDEDVGSKDQGNTGQYVEYIFIEKESIEIANPDTDISRNLTENDKGNVPNVDDTSMSTEELDAELLNCQSLTNEVKKEMPEKANVNLLLSELEEIYPNVIVKRSDENQAIDKDIGKRMRSNPQTPDRLHKKCKYGGLVKKISIIPKDYPQSEITNKMAGEIQKSILASIDYTEELPLLKCHGIQDGALVYSCHTEKSFNLIENVIQSLDLQVSVMQEQVNNSYKITVKINSFINESVESIFDRLETYNMCLNTKDWKVIKFVQNSDSVVLFVEIDESSLKVIAKDNFSLYSGTDEAKFSIVWD